MRPNVFTYYMPVPGLWSNESQQALLEIWRTSWYKAGWNPVVLDETFLQGCPQYAAYKEKYWSLPTEYGHDYEGACFIRWLATAHLGGGMMVDYDVINYGFEPRKPDPTQMILFCDDPPGTIFMGAVLGIREHFQEMADIFATWEPSDYDINWGTTWYGKHHCSDLTMLERMFDHKNRERPPWLIRQPGCALFDYPTWRTSKLVHYGFRMKAAGFWPKADWINKIRPI